MGTFAGHGRHAPRDTVVPWGYSTYIQPFNGGISRNQKGKRLVNVVSVLKSDVYLQFYL